MKITRPGSLLLALLGGLAVAGTGIAQETAPAEPSDPSPAAAPNEDADAADPRTAAERLGREVLEKAAVRQGTAARRGEKAILRFRANLSVTVYGESGTYQTTSDEACAEPKPRREHLRVHSEFTAEGKHVRLGHDGVKGWIWSKEDKTRLLTDPEGRDRADYEDLEHRQRMLGLARRAFFLGNLLDDGTPVRHMGESDLTLPPLPGREEPRKHRAVRLRRDAAGGHPTLDLWLDAETLDPVAIIIPPVDEGESEHLLVVGYEDPELRAAKDLPAGLRVPFAIELWERYPDGPRERVLRIDAVIDRLRIDPADVPDSLFDAP